MSARHLLGLGELVGAVEVVEQLPRVGGLCIVIIDRDAVSYTHLRAHETVLDLVCRLLLEKKKSQTTTLNLTTYPTMVDR